ncbi:MAG: pyridoxal-phosphate dependent enzyme, partial [Microbacteriaceae bacterium]|nr:pyridoxal-phosphate dependent enzyme [Microbacteriaceae bacterium]
MKYAETIVDLIGGTPLVRLNRVTEGIAATVLAKVEYLNPGGSSKDRIATRIIDAAERDGL